MKSKILFVFTVISVCSPISVMADQMKNYAKGDTKVGCNRWAAEKLMAMDAEKKTTQAVYTNTTAHKSAQAK